MAARPHVVTRPKFVEAFSTVIISKSCASFPPLIRLQTYQIEFDPVCDSWNGDQFAMFDVSRIRIEEHPARVPDQGFEYFILN